MKILLAGAFSSDPSIYTYATSFLHTLIAQGHNVLPYNTRPTELIRFAPSSYHDYAFVHMAQKFRPELTFLIKAEKISTHTLRTIKQNIRCTIINFYTDNPFTLWNYNSNATVLERLPELDCFLSWSHTLINPLLTAGCAHVCRFPFAYDEKIFNQPITITEEEHKKYTADVCFVGTWEPEREHWLAALHGTLPNMNLAIWGNQWEKQCTDAHLKKCIRGPAVYHQTLIKIFRSSKIVLNFIRIQNMGSHNMRTFEVPASAAFLLTQRTQEQACEYFKEEESIACFGNLEELVNKVTLYLGHEDKRTHIRQQGYQRAQEFTLSRQLQKYFTSCPVFSGTRIGTWNAAPSSRSSPILK
jgi:spore maturation protein CgeB